MTITTRPSRGGPSLLGGSIDVPVNAVPARAAAPGLAVDRRARDRRLGRRRRCRQDGPAAGGPVRRPRLAGHRGRRQRRPSSTRSTRAARTSARSRAWSRRSPTAHAAGRLTGDHRRDGGGAGGRRRRDHRPGHARRRASSRTTATWTRRSTRSRRAPRRLAGHLRDDAAGRRHARPVRAAPRGGERAARSSEDLLRRLLAGAAPVAAHVFQNLATYPKLVGGIGPASTARAAAFYASRPRRRGRGDEQSPRRPSSRSSPRRPTATSTSPWPTSSPTTPSGSASTSSR